MNYVNLKPRYRWEPRLPTYSRGMMIKSTLFLPTITIVWSYWTTMPYIIVISYRNFHVKSSPTFFFLYIFVCAPLVPMCIHSLLVHVVNVSLNCHTIPHVLTYHLLFAQFSSVNLQLPKNGFYALVYYCVSTHSHIPMLHVSYCFDTSLGCRLSSTWP